MPCPLAFPIADSASVVILTPQGRRISTDEFIAGRLATERSFASLRMTSHFMIPLRGVSF
jgi:hypothetical protein